MDKAALDREVAELRKEAREEWACVDTRHEEFVTHADVQFAELKAEMGSIKEMLAILVANSTTGKGTPMEETQAQSQAWPNEGNHSEGQAQAEQLAPQGTSERKEEIIPQRRELAPQGTIERTFGHEGQLNRAAQQLIGEQRESEAEDGFRHSTKLQLAAGRAACEQRAMEKKPGRLLRPPSLSEPTTWARPNRINGDEEPPPEPPPGQSQSALKVRYGMIVPDRRLTMEMVESWETRMQNIVRMMIQERVGVESPSGTPKVPKTPAADTGVCGRRRFERLPI